MSVSKNVTVPVGRSGACRASAIPGWYVDHLPLKGQSDNAADARARAHRVEYPPHGIGALLPGELDAAGLRLTAELIAKHRIGQQPLEAVHHFGVVVDEQTGHAVDDRVDQP